MTDNPQRACPHPGNRPGACHPTHHEQPPGAHPTPCFDHHNSVRPAASASRTPSCMRRWLRWCHAACGVVPPRSRAPPASLTRCRYAAPWTCEPPRPLRAALRAGHKPRPPQRATPPQLPTHTTPQPRAYRPPHRPASGQSWNPTPNQPRPKAAKNQQNQRSTTPNR